MWKVQSLYGFTQRDPLLFRENLDELRHNCLCRIRTNRLQWDSPRPSPIWNPITTGLSRHHSWSNWAIHRYRNFLKWDRDWDWWERYQSQWRLEGQDKFGKGSILRFGHLPIGWSTLSSRRPCGWVDLPAGYQRNAERQDRPTEHSPFAFCKVVREYHPHGQRTNLGRRKLWVTLCQVPSSIRQDS